MDFIYIGKYVNTHGIKGEIRIISDLSNKDEIFKKNFKIYIGNKKQEFIINTYRKHKNFDMVTLDGINNINDIVDLKGSSVYINRYDLNKNTIFDQDYIGLKVYTDKCVGEVVDILKTPSNDILVVKGNSKKFMIPKVDHFIKEVDIDSKKLHINVIEGLIDED